VSNVIHEQVARRYIARLKVTAEERALSLSTPWTLYACSLTTEPT